MLKHVPRIAVVLFVGLCLALPSCAATVMINVRADFSSALISPNSMERAKQMVIDVESNLMEQFFDLGHIAINLPAAIRTSATTEKAPTPDELLWATKKGGAEILVYCTIALHELDPLQPIQVVSCSIITYDINGGSDFPLKLMLPITAATRDTDLRADIIRCAQLITSRLQS